MSEVSVFSNHHKPGGTFVFTDKDTGKVSEYHSAQCVHCGTHWQVVPGSGRTRGFCLKCMGLVCSAECRECVPKEAQLELWEGNRKAILKYHHTEAGRRILAEQERAKRMEEAVSLVEKSLAGKGWR